MAHAAGGVGDGLLRRAAGAPLAAAGRAGRRVLGPHRVAFTERGLRALARTGLSYADMMGLLLTLTGYVHGSAQIFLGAATAARAEGIDEQEFGAAYGRALAAVVTEQRFPLLAEVLAAGVFEIPDEDGMQDFRYGLDRLLDGFAVQIEDQG
ncbi:MAG: hypothetical protein GEV07_03935 [Streptosporangiales bacterium]|nr:hypothetical protein [Streptosporangiales bacterium]